MSRKSMISKRGYEHTDFSDLLNELQGNAESSNSVDNLTSKKASIPMESEKRHRIMSDQNVKYLYSKQSNMIHDKHCPCARKISDDDLEWSKIYRPGWKPCPKCVIQAYVAAGAKDPEEIDAYKRFFKKVGMTEALVKKVYIDHSMKTRIFSDAMVIWHKEDKWRIKALPEKGHVQLHHNNYIVKRNGVREFTQGYHIQNEGCTDAGIEYVLYLIQKYEYKSEKYMLHSSRTDSVERGYEYRNNMQQEKIDVQSDSLLDQSAESLTIWQKIKRFFKNMFKKKD